MTATSFRRLPSKGEDLLSESGKEIRRLARFVTRVSKLLGWSLLAPLAFLFPRNPRKILFGAWMGKQFSCHPKCLFQYLAPRGEFTCIWVGEEPLRDSVLKVPHARFVRKGSLAALWHGLTAKFYVSNINWRSDIINFPRCRRVTLVYTTHGYASKYVGVKQFAGQGPAKEESAKPSFLWLREALDVFDNWLFGRESWCSESSERAIQVGLSNTPFIMTPEKALRFGKPRADYFLANRNNAEEQRRLKEKIAYALGIPASKKWYVYVPTWRHDVAKAFSFTTMEKRDEVVRLLASQDAILIEKQHPIILKQCRLSFGLRDGIAVLTNEQALLLDTQELLMASDRMITDYSSIYYDFVLLNRPVIHYAPDFDEFMERDMGFNFDIREYGGGPFAYTEDELLALMRLGDDELLCRRSPKIMSEHLTYEKGTACESYERFFRTFPAKRSALAVNTPYGYRGGVRPSCDARCFVRRAFDDCFIPAFEAASRFEEAA